MLTLIVTGMNWLGAFTVQLKATTEVLIILMKKLSSVGVQTRRSHVHVADGVAAGMSRMLWTTPASRGGCCFVSEGQIPARQKTPAWENVPLLLRRRLECQRREVTAGMAARGGRFIGIPSWRRRLTEALAGPVPQVGGATFGFLAALEGHGPSAGIRGGGWSLGGGLGGNTDSSKRLRPQTPSQRFLNN